MLNFSYWNPVRIEFGKGTIRRLASLIPKEQKVLLTYGGGSIKQNGVYEQVRSALRGREVLEFPGIEPNPRYETCLNAVDVARAEGIGFLLAVGGGSVLDGTKFIAAAVKYEGEDPWDMLDKGAEFHEALPLGSVLTLPATGSEMNPFSVISRESTGQKLAFSNPCMYPQFSILDPETTFSLPARQVRNGIVDAFVHVFEQYMTYDVAAPLQDRQSEAVLQTLVEVAPVVRENPNDYDARATLMWCATNALNCSLGCGVPQDWTTHMIGHELTAAAGVDHAQTLALVLPAVLSHQRTNKRKKLLQYGKRVWEIEGTSDETIDAIIRRTVDFFAETGMATRLAECGITKEHRDRAVAAIRARGEKLGEHKNIGSDEVAEILALIP